MVEFENNELITGYIKQLLSSYYLPTCKVYTNEDTKYYQENGKESDNILLTIPDRTNQHIRFIPYIKDGKIQEYKYNSELDKNIWETIIPSFAPDTNIANYTKQFHNNSIVYDYQTHEYLGNYLRFLRDYYNMNLMPLYNCFNNRICSSLDLTFSKSLSNTKSITYSFKTTNNSYKIFMIPVKLFQEYTIAIDAQKVELCCGIYSKYQDTRDKFNNLSTKTYLCKFDTKFNKPFKFDKLLYNNLKYSDGKSFLDPTSDMELAQNEQDLKLFIKVPFSNNSTITILEGDYAAYNDSIKIITNTSMQALKNKAIHNFEDLSLFNPITNLQLLRFNTGKQHPFADRLIEYLLFNTVDTVDTVSDNIKRVQTVYADRSNSYTGVYGSWDTKLQCSIYEFLSSKTGLTTNEIAKIQPLTDILGFADKDAEKYYRGLSTDENNNYIINLMNVDIYDKEN